MIKVAVIDDYQEVFQQIIEIKKYKEKFSCKMGRSDIVSKSRGLF